MRTPAYVNPLVEGFNELNGHRATVGDVVVAHAAMCALFNIGLCPHADVEYIAEALNTFIMIESFHVS